MDIPIKQKTKLFFCYELTQIGFESLCNDFGYDFVDHIATRDWSEVVKISPLYFLGMRVMKVAFIAPNTFHVLYDSLTTFRISFFNIS